MRDREKEGTHTVVGMGCHGKLTKKMSSLSGDGERHTDVVVGKYTQTRQRRLRVKMVKSSHDRHYKKEPLLCTVGTTTVREEDRIENLKTKK